jgi:hypothetical protein
LNRVLITNVELQNLCTSSGGIGPVIQKYPAWFVWRSIEWDLYLNTALAAENLNALIWYQLRATSEYRLPGRKMQYGGGYDVGSHLRIFFY